MIESLAIQDSKREGRKEAKMEDARSFYANGVSVEIIAKSLGMTIEQVKDIVKDSVQKEAQKAGLFMEWKRQKAYEFR